MRKRANTREIFILYNKKTGPTRFELATSGVTGRRSHQAELRPRLCFYFKGNAAGFQLWD